VALADRLGGEDVVFAHSSLVVAASS
jgi:hypothetical protein